MGRLGVSRPSALVAGPLFALTPYAPYRSTGHIWLLIYLVPFICTAALLLAFGRLDRWYWLRESRVDRRLRAHRIQLRLLRVLRLLRADRRLRRRPPFRILVV